MSVNNIFFDCDIAEMENKAEKEYYNVLENKTVSFLGDSYFAGNGLDKSLVWPYMLASKYNMNYGNYGMNGSPISNYVTTISPMVDRYMSMADNSPDIVIVEGGRNDFCQRVPLGEDGSLDTKTFKGAVRYLLTKLKDKYPNAVIIG
ncbi:MAG: SGNH/GDSL hydrolase family protein, partial [Clostridia bacterium]|nr:SGNH/GDSL hydrolase family protein [Clostridia bacterium]